MGILDTIQGMAGQAGNAPEGDHPKVAGGFLKALTEHPGGMQGVLDSFRKNGLDQHVGAWSAGNMTPATPEQVEQGLGGTGLIERTAQHAGVSPQVAQMALATILPMMIQHFAPNGQIAPQSSMGSLAGQFLDRFLQR